MATIHTLQKTFLPAIAPEDFFLLLSHATHKPKVFLFAHPEYELTEKEAETTQRFLKRRLKHEPVAYITGHKEFYGEINPALIYYCKSAAVKFSIGSCKAMPLQFYLKGTNALSIFRIPTDSSSYL